MQKQYRPPRGGGRRIGVDCAAADLIFTSRAVDANEASKLGLLNRLSRPPLLGAAIAYAGLEAALRYETAGLSYARPAPNDVKESRASFLEKRPGVYTGT